MGAELIAFTRAVITPEAQAAAQRSLASGWLTTGPECVAFEQEFAAWVGAREAVAVSSCTAALELSLRALDLPAGARVLVPTVTFCGVASAVLHAGLVPVLADVDPLTATMSPATASAAARAAGGVRAMVVLHYAGSPAPVRRAGRGRRRADVARRRGRSPRRRHARRRRPCRQPVTSGLLQLLRHEEPPDR